MNSAGCLYNEKALRRKYTQLYVHSLCTFLGHQGGILKLADNTSQNIVLENVPMNIKKSIVNINFCGQTNLGNSELNKQTVFFLIAELLSL